MAVKVGINGFGRIGRLVLRAAFEAKRKDVEFVAINDLGSAEANAHLLNYDSVHGTYPGKIQALKDSIKVDGHKVRVLAERDPAALPWGELGVDIVMECTGLFTKKELAAKHLEAGAKKVLVLEDYQKKLEVENLEYAVDFGWFWFFTKPFFFALHYIVIIARHEISEIFAFASNSRRLMVK